MKIKDRIRFFIATKILGATVFQVNIKLLKDYEVENQINKLLQKRGYVEHLSHWRNGFVCVQVDKSGVKIWHDTNTNNTGICFTPKVSFIKNVLLDIETALNYFEYKMNFKYTRTE